MNTIKVYRNGYEFQYCPEQPNFRFKGGGSVKPPPPPVAPPIAIPDTGPETEEQARRKRPRGRQGTFLTGDLIPEDANKKKRLG